MAAESFCGVEMDVPTGAAVLLFQEPPLASIVMAFG